MKIIILEITFEHPHITLATGTTNNLNFLKTYKKTKIKTIK